MKKIILFNLLLSIPFLSIAQKNVKVTFSSDPNASITVNGQAAGTGSAQIKLGPNQCIKVTSKLEGKYAKYLELCNNGIVKIAKSYYIELQTDAAYAASVATNVANIDINIRPKKSQADSWKQINSLILQYIDAIEISDKDNMYLRTAWVSQTFNSGIVRTRVIVKTQGDQQFSIKLVSEIAEVGTKVSEDEKFVPYDRVLNKYAKIIEELQSRL
jgi:hypothetical protein